MLMRSCYRNMTQLMVLAAMSGPEGSLSKKVTTLVDTYEIEFIPGKQYTDQPIVKV